MSTIARKGNGRAAGAGEGKPVDAEVLAPSGPPPTYEELLEVVCILATVCKGHWLGDESFYSTVANVVSRYMVADLMERLGVDVMSEAALRGLDRRAVQVRDMLLEQSPDLEPMGDA